MNTKYKRDDFGNRMKSYENVGNNLKLIPNLPTVVTGESSPILLNMDQK